MSMSVDQMIDILSDMFKEIDKETLFLILQSNKYDLDITLETLMTMEGSNTPHNNNNNNNKNERPNQNSNNNSNNNNNNTNNKKNNKRGSNIQLPDDFLRVPGYQEKQKEYVETGSLLNLLADPIFLQELEREFGPNYQSVLREHLQAEALRSTVDRAPYSDRPTNQNQNPSAPRHFYVQPIPDSSYLPQSPGAPQYYSHQYYNNVPPPYSHSNVSVGQQQPAVLAHQNQTPTSSSPPSSTSSSSSWFFSPPASTQRTVDPSNTNNSQNSNTSTATTSGTMVGFGGGSQPPPRDDGPSISDRFQSVLKSFTSTFNSSDTSKKPENRQLLGQNDYDDDDNDDDGEEGVWEGGIQMETRQNRSHSESANL